MMKYIAMLIVVLGFYGCASVRYINPESGGYVSVGLDFNDLLLASSSSVDSLLESRFVKNLPEGEDAKVLVISDFINDTMQKFDIDQVTRRVTRALRESQKFVLSVAMDSRNREAMLDRVREARENEEYAQSSQIAKGNLLVPSLSLSGKVVQRNTLVEKNQRVDYYFLLSLVDLKSGIVVWDHEVNISKVTSKQTSTW